MKRLGYLYSIGAALTWGLVYTIDQRVLKVATPITVMFIDAVATAVILAPAAYFDRGPIREFLHSGHGNVALAVTSLVLAILANFLIYSGIAHLGASNASIIEIAYPFFVVIFSFIFLKQGITWPTLAGGLLIFMGTAIVIKFS